jgi:hypothetical protein
MMGSLRLIRPTRLILLHTVVSSVNILLVNDLSIKPFAHRTITANSF